MNLSCTTIPEASIRIDSFGAALRGAIARLRWRAVATAFMIALAVNTWSTLELVFPAHRSFSQGLVSNAIINLAMAFCIMFTTLVADQRVASGAGRFATYGWSVAAGAAIGALVQWQLHQWLGVPYSDDVPGVPHEQLVMRPVYVFFEYLIWGSIIVFIYVNRRNALFAAAELNAARVRRTEAQRRTLESRLKALQARVEPQFLFDALAKVRDLYEDDPGRGSAVLGNLIVYLRSALPQLRESTSTLGHEIGRASCRERV